MSAGTGGASAAPLPVHAGLHLPDWLVQNRNFVFLWLAYGIAALGDHLSEMALLQQRGGLERSDVTRLQALLTFGFFLPFVLLGPIAGWWSDRFSRKGTMIAADLIRAVLVFSLAWIVLGLERLLEPGRGPGDPPTPLGDLAILIPVLLIGALAAFFSPARQSMLPTLVRDDQLVRANALISALGTIGAILSGVLGGWMVDQFAGRLHYSYYANAATFCLSALFVSLIAMSRTRATPHPPMQGMLTPVVEGFRYVWSHRRVLQMILLGAVFWGCAGVVISVVPALVREMFGAQMTEVAIYRGLIAVGLAAGAAVMSIIGPSMPLQLTILSALAAAGAWVLLLDAAYLMKMNRVVTGLCLVGIGGAGAALLVSVMATIQRFVPDSRRGRVFGVSDTTTMGAMVLTSGVLGLAPIPDLDSYIPWLLLGTGLALLGSCAAAYVIYRRRAVTPPVTSLVWKIIRFYANFWCGMKREGPCTIPATGPVIVAANHSSGVDPMLMLASSPHRVISFVVTANHYHKPLLNYFMRLAACIPIDRDKPQASSLKASLQVLESGGVLGLFPQGEFQNPDGAQIDARRGVGTLALRSEAVVVPCFISGTRFHDNWLAGFFQRHKARIRFGKPIDLSAYRERGRNGDVAREAAEEIMRQIRALGPDA